MEKFILSNKSLANKIIATLIIFCMIFANFALVGSNIASAVAEELENQATITKGENISFDAYFEKEGREHQTELNIEEEQNLHLEISVKDKFSISNATIKIEDANFSIIKDKITENKYVNNVNTDTNEIELKNISSNTVASIVLPIQFKKSDVISTNYLNKEINITLNGKYENTNKREKELEGSVKIKPMWTANAEINLTQSIEKYFSLGANGTLVQQKVQTEVVKNILPRNTETIQTNVPIIANEKPENVTVLIDGDRVAEENVIYNKNEGTVIVSYKNIDNNEGNLNWGSDKKEYTIMYHYTSTAPLVETPVELRTSSQTSLYSKGDNINKEDVQALAITPIGNIATVETQLTGDIYKGYLYDNEAKEMDYIEKNAMVVSYTEGIEKLEMQTNNSIYTNEEGQGIIPTTNIRYKETKINKNEFLNMFGENGTFTIKRANGEVITTITKDTEADEQGIITVTYGEAETNIIVETTAPQTEGKMIVLNTKSISGEINQPRELVKQIRNIVVAPEIATNISKEGTMATIELKESTTQASIETNATSLTTTQENENVEIKATLKTNSPSQDLYANPVVTIEFPKDVQAVKVNSVNKLYGDEFATVNASQGVVDGKQVIRMELIGEQKEHKDAGTEGTVIDINANLTLNNRALNKKDSIVMTYANAKANQYKDAAPIGTEEAVVDIVSPRSLITTNSISELGVSTVGEQKGVNVTIPTGAEQKVLTVESEVINNNESEISDVKVMGTFGTKGKAQIGKEEYENNINTQLTTALNVEGIDSSKVRVYYTENEKATDDLENLSNRWEQTVTNTGAAKKYLVQVSDMDVAETMKISYGISVPENLQYKQQMYQGYSVKYNDNQASSAQEMEATTIALKTANGPQMVANLTAVVGGEVLENDSEVNRNEIIRYDVEVENTGDEDLTNVQAKVEIPEGTTLISREGLAINKEEATEKTIQIEEIKAKESKTVSFEVIVNNEAETGMQIKSKATVSFEEKSIDSNEVTVKVGKQSGDLQVAITYFVVSTQTYKEGDNVNCRMEIKNTTDHEIKNVKAKWNAPAELERISNRLTTDVEFAPKNDETITIESIGPGQSALVDVIFKVVENSQKDKVSVSGIVTAGSNTYRSTTLDVDLEYLKGFDLSINSDVQENGYVQSGDAITYSVRIKNNSNIEYPMLNVVDQLPSQVSLAEASITSQDGNTDEVKAVDNKINKVISLGPEEEKTLTAKVLINYQGETTENIPINNKVELMEKGNVVGQTKTIQHIIGKPQEEPLPSTDPSSEPSTNPSTEPTTNPSSEPGENPNPTSKGTISGYAWVDGDLNGAKDDYENTVENMTVKLLNIETNEFAKDENGNQIQSATDSTGLYTLQNIPQGEYVVIFEYDTRTYKLTEYQKPGVDASSNSKAISKTLRIDGEEKTYGITDMLAIQENSNVSNINIGLVTTGKFDFALEKYISKITVRTNDGDVKTYNYDKEVLAKVELDGKKMEGANLIIEYKIEAKNVGEVSGYVKTIDDYMPEDMVFNSELNQDWYQTGTVLRTNSLQNKAIAPGESGVVTLILTKTMTESNTGIMGNTAEITEAYNEEGTQDINSTPGNGDKNEDDYSAADTIVSVKTGSEMVYTVLILVIVSMIGVGVYFIRKETLDMSEDIFKGL